jgi:hypothetical protein
MILTYEVNGRIVDIEFDSMMRSSDVLSSTVTKHPIEKGFDANDHIKKNPDTFTFDATVSNTPLHLPGSPRDSTSGGAKIDARGASVSYDVIENGQRSTRSASLAIVQFDRPFDRVGDVYEEIKFIADNCIPVSVNTTDWGGFRDYENMALLNVTTPTDVGDGTSRTFSFQLQALHIVTTQKVDAPQLKQTGNRGEKGKTEVKEDTEAHLKSVSASVFDSAASWAKGH